MSQINLGLVLDPENQVHMQAAAGFFATLAGDSTSTSNKVEASPVEEKKTKKTASSKKASGKVEKEAPKEEAPKEEAPKEEAPKEEAPKEEAPKAVDVDELRSLLTRKVKAGAENRKAAKEKMTALGANNVSTLAESKYGEFYKFLETLPDE